LGGGARIAGGAAKLGLSRNAARTAGAVGASYPSSVGDVLSNQREETGTTNAPAAFGLGVPYAALNAFGVEGALARNSGFRVATDLLDNAKRFGAAKRMAATGGVTALSEGASETGQEFINQAGRNSVNPDAGYFGDAAMERYGESFVGGAALGGLAGGLGGGWRRSEGWKDPNAKAPTPVDPARPQEQRAPRNLLDGADPNNLIGGEYSPLNNQPKAEDPQALAGRYHEIQRTLDGMEYTMQNLQGQFDQASQAGDTATMSRLQNQRAQIYQAGTELFQEQQQLEPLVQRYYADTAGTQLSIPKYEADRTTPDAPLSFAQIEGISRPTRYSPEFTDQSLGLRPPPLSEEERRKQAIEHDVFWNSGSGTRVSDQAGPQVERELPIGDYAALQSGELDKIAAADQKHTAKRDAARTALLDTQPPGAKPAKLRPLEIQTFDTLNQLREQKKISEAEYTDRVGQMRDAIRANDNKTLNDVAKEVAIQAETANAAPSPAPAAPKPVKNVVIGTPKPNVGASTPSRTGPSTGSGAGNTVAGGSVVAGGSNPVATKPVPSTTNGNAADGAAPAVVRSGNGVVGEQAVAAAPAAQTVTPEQAAADAEMLELHKQVSVLRAIRKCLNS
jgi:hypothetical protein